MQIDNGSYFCIFKRGFFYIVSFYPKALFSPLKDYYTAMLLVKLLLWRVLPEDKCTFSVMLWFLIGMNSPWSNSQCLTAEKLSESFGTLGGWWVVWFELCFVLFWSSQVKGEASADLEPFAKFKNLLRFLTVDPHIQIKPEIDVI